MASSEAFQLAILLSLKDGASGGLDRFEAKLRAAGKEGEKFAKDLDTIRSNLSRDLAIGGVGIAGLALLKKGVDAAADYQSVMTDLRATIAQTGKDGIVDRNKLATDMLAAEAVAVRLGNKLPGTTADFAEMMQVLKQNGLDTKTIVNGAADAVGNLAVASNAMPKEIAADFARFGNLFKLRAEDFTPAADVFSRIYSSTGQTSQELVEAAKYFQGRAGTSLGISGLKDAEQMTRLFGFMGKQGMSGSMAGMGLTNFFDEYNTHRDKLDDLQKATGIKLDFFDKKGKFLGLESVIQQMTQFDKLNERDRSAWMQTMFGTLGKGAGNILMQAGAWKQFNAEQDKTISLSDKTAMKAKDFNNQMEALKGTLTNLQVAVFESMLPGLTSTVSAANELVGQIQLFTKTHPDIAKYAVSLAALGSTAMIAYAGVSSLVTGVRLFRMASMFSRGEGLAAHLTAASTAATSLTAKDRALQQLGGTIAVTGDKTKSLATQLGSADKKAAGLRGNMAALGNSGMVKVGVQIGAIMLTEAAIIGIVGRVQEVIDRATKAGQRSRDFSGAYDAEFFGGSSRDDTAKRFFEAFDFDGRLVRELHPERTSPDDSYFRSLTGASFWDDIIGSSPYGFAETGNKGFANSKEMIGFNVNTAANWLKKQGLGAAARDPESLAAVLRGVQDYAQKNNLNEGDVAKLTAAIEKLASDTYPENLKAAREILNANKPTPTAASLFGSLLGPKPLNTFGGFAPPTVDFNQPITNFVSQVTNMGEPVGKTAKSFTDLLGPADKLPTSFGRLNTSANSVADSLSIASSNIANWRPPSTPSSAFNPDGTPIINPPGFAVGGNIKRSGLAFVHAGETVVPAKASPFNPDVLQSVFNSRTSSGDGQSVVINAPLTLHINGADETTARSFQKKLDDHARHIGRLVAKQMANGRARA